VQKRQKLLNISKLLIRVSKRTSTSDSRGRKEIRRRAETHPKHTNDTTSAQFARSSAPAPNHTSSILYIHSSQSQLFIRYPLTGILYAARGESINF